MQASVLVDEGGRLGLQHLRQHRCPRFFRQGRIQAGDGVLEAPNEHHIAIGRAFGPGAIRSDLQARGDRKA
jgi:hypothetical protein